VSHGSWKPSAFGTEAGMLRRRREALSVPRTAQHDKITVMEHTNPRPTVMQSAAVRERSDLTAKSKHPYRQQTVPGCGDFDLLSRIQIPH
jgi:hypothetical protein